MKFTTIRLRKWMSAIAASVMVATLVCAVAVAQTPMNQKVDVAFDFSAAGQDLSAGSYRVKMAKDQAGAVELVLVGKNGEARLPVVTRLAPVAGSVTTVKLVFDKVESKHILSEVWLPTFDGFLISGGQGEHEHDVVAGQPVK